MTNQFRYPNLIKFMLLAILLIVPFLLRFINGKLEIYPAVLLPSGASLIDTQDTLLFFNKYYLYGIERTQRNKIQLDPKQFIQPIPLRYLPGLIESGFGLDSVNVNSVDIRRLAIHYENRLYFSASQIETTKVWLRTKLKEQSCSDSLFFVASLKVMFNQVSEKIDSSIIIDEKVFNLY